MSSVICQRDDHQGAGQEPNDRDELEFEVSVPQRQNEYGFNGVSYAEVSKIAIEVSWFGEPNPFRLMGSMAESGNPFT